MEERRDLPPLIPHGDQAVQDTTDEAASSKLSAVTLGYFTDPYLKFFVKKPTRRAPLINRGYYSRNQAIRQVVSTFMASSQVQAGRAQVVNLGAGLDTLFFWTNDNWKNLTFFEVDFPEVIVRKTSIICRHKELWSKLTDKLENLETNSGYQVVSDKLKMIPVDMRRIQEMQAALEKHGLENNVPTIFVAECVLVYMQPSESDNLIRWASAAVPHSLSTMLVYEQINPSDAFGRTMVANLEARGCPLLSLSHYPTISSQKRRYTSLGWDRCCINDMIDIYDNQLTVSERLRIQSLEIFDEIEEWQLIQAHYIIIIASSNFSTCSSDAELHTTQQHLSALPLGQLMDEMDMRSS